MRWHALARAVGQGSVATCWLRNESRSQRRARTTFRSECPETRPLRIDV